jgi:hypothetical protein
MQQIFEILALVVYDLISPQFFNKLLVICTYRSKIKANFNLSFMGAMVVTEEALEILVSVAVLVWVLIQGIDLVKKKKHIVKPKKL